MPLHNDNNINNNLQGNKRKWVHRVTSTYCKKCLTESNSRNTLKEILKMGSEHTILKYLHLT